MEQLNNLIKSSTIKISALLATGASLGSLVLSEVFNLVPCTLCWYQRFIMFGLAGLLVYLAYRYNRRLVRLTAALAAGGAAVAFYHSLLQWGIITEEVISCSINSSCAEPQINWFGFITIPFMALITFSSILALLALDLRKKT